MTENKVQFNLKNVHYALLTETITEGTVGYSWAVPIRVPGAVNLSLEAQGEITPFYADGIVYYQTVANNGYSGDLEMARFIDQMMKDVWGWTEGATSKVLTENASIEPKAFALLFQIDGDAGNECYVMYNCSGTRPAISSTTNTDTKEPVTQTSTISAVPLADGTVFARTTANTPTDVKTSWFTSVFREVPTQAE